ncbi:hypothetical protein [Ferribacterium limneticum]|uniref:hypothetical protein n=1 Tax=Ferribacterium limneticum TaxID=76259 RepID=UPI001CF94536|nr:hypothetical protein [Ferribacterium limneticum]UCV27780.1 hypothetical protein KI617_16200 [Ferribacterium limneticum]UCV31697.1 hypothetical protein KI608_16200 [Ferribacterium limneticum]
MPQAHTLETVAPTRDNDDRLSRLLIVSALSVLSMAGIVFLVSDIVELFQVLAIESGVRNL